MTLRGDVAGLIVEGIEGGVARILHGVWEHWVTGRYQGTRGEERGVMQPWEVNNLYTH